jgi:phage terminase large subunit-like protein
MFRVMTQGSSDARRQPLHLFISTAGNDVHSIGYELHRKAVDIRDGKKIDPAFLPVIYQLEDGDDWTDPKNWVKANPSIGVTFGYETLARAVENAKQNPAEENSLRQLRMNQWVKQSVRWMPMRKWNACAFPVNEDELRGRECYGGLDLSSTTDITAFVLVFTPSVSDGKYVVLPYFWLPDETLDLRVKRDRVPYDVWQKKGLIMTTEGNVVHYEEIETFIGLLKDKYDIKEIAYDRWAATMLVQRLTDAGLCMVPFGQGFASMSSPTKELMKLVLEERLAHGGNAPLAWMADNMTVRTDPAGNIKPDKEKSTEKIDGIVALIMALDRAVKGGGGNAGSVYDERGILVI